MSSSTIKIKDLLEKAKHYDADERFMAAHDLVEQLKVTQGLIDATVQVPLRDTILRLLDDGSSDVSTVAVKCLSQLTVKLAPEQIAYISDRLGSMIGDPQGFSQSINQSVADDGTNDKRGSSLDVVADALQTLISNVSMDNARLIAPKLIKSLIAGISINQSNSKDIDGVMACLTLIKQVLEKVGTDATVVELHGDIQAKLIELLDHPNEAVKKRASATLAPLVLCLNDELFTALMQKLIDQLTKQKHPEIYIQSVSAISRAAGVRVGPFLPAIVPKLASFCVLTPAEREGEEPQEARIEMLETCLQAIDAIIQRCPTKVTPYVSECVSTAVALSQWDPMYSYEDDASSNQASKKQKTGDSMTDDDEGDEWGAEGGDDEGWGDDAEAGGDAAAGWGDDEDASAGSNDTSWKVRRAAFSVLSAFIKARSDMLKDYYSSLCDHLVGRMKEHDPAVKEELMLCTRDLLHESVVADRSNQTIMQSMDMSDDMPSNQPTITRTRSTFASLELKIPALIQAIEREFSSTDSRTQRAIFAVLTELFHVKYGQLADYFAKLLPHVITGIRGSGRLAEVNADALALVLLILESHPFESFESYLPSITDATLDSIQHGKPQNLPAALTVISSIAKLSKKSPQLRTSIASRMFAVVFGQLDQRDVPLDVKFAAIATCANLVSAAAPELGNDVQRVWPVLAERLSNDTTCQPTLKAITKIAKSGQSINCKPIIDQTSEMIGFLRKSSPDLRHETARCLEALMQSNSSQFTRSQSDMLLKEVTSFIDDDNDLTLAHHILDLITTMLVKTNDVAHVLSAIDSQVTVKALNLACSPLIQSSTQQSLLRFFRQLMVARRADAQTLSKSFATLSQQLAARVTPTLNKIALGALAKCLAASALEVSEQDLKQSISQAVAAVQTAKPNAQQQALAAFSLLYLSEISRARDMSDVAQIESVCVSAFDQSNEAVRGAAAIALGSFSIGNPQRFLPSLFSLIQAQPQHGFLLFTALKEVITHLSTHQSANQIRPVDPASIAAFQAFMPSILPLLLANVTSSDESTRSMVSECLGRVAAFSPALILPEFEKLANNKTNVLARVGVLTALRFAFSSSMDYSQLVPKLPLFLTLLQDKELEVARQAILTTDALLRANSECLPRELLSTQLVPAVLAHTRLRPELIHEIDYGAFKQKVDDGKPVRKASFACLDTLVKCCPHRIDLHACIAALVQGFGDNDDIQQSVYITLAHLARAQPSALLEQVDTFPKSMMAPVKAHLAALKSNKDNEQAMDSLRAAVKAMLAINQIEGIESATNYSYFFRQVGVTPVMAALIKEEQK